MSNQFPKDVQDFLHNYHGPYPLNQLRKARDTLIYGFNTYNSQTFHRLYRLMYMENVSRESNWEYSEDNCSESESEADLLMNTNLGSKAGVKPKAQRDICSEQGTEVRSKAGQSKSEVQPECRPETSNDTTFISRAGFKNRFAQQLLGKEAVNVIKKKALEKGLFDTDARKVARKSGDPTAINYVNGKVPSNQELIIISSENGDTDDDNCHSVPKKAKMSLDSSDSEKDLIDGFKCDYCNFTSLDCDETYLHLERAQHPSAVRCRGVLVDQMFSPRFIMKEMCLQSDLKSSTKLATCPKCFTPFTDIYTCAEHSSNCSNKSLSNLDGLYAISDIVRDVNILIPVDSICQTCKLKCSKHRALNLHYEACQHYPYDRPTSADILINFICPYCKKDIDNFFAAKAHVITHAAKFPRVFMALQLIYYKKTTIGQKLLEYLPVKSRTGIKSTKKKRKMLRNFE